MGAAGEEGNRFLFAFLQAGPFLDEDSKYFDYLVAVEQFATRSLCGAAFQFRLQLLKPTIWLLTHGRLYFAD